jgi:hypothetical protein
MWVRSVRETDDDDVGGARGEKVLARLWVGVPNMAILIGIIESRVLCRRIREMATSMRVHAALALSQSQLVGPALDGWLAGWLWSVECVELE